MFKILKILGITIGLFLAIGIITLVILICTNKIEIDDLHIKLSLKKSKTVVVDKEYDNVFSKIIIDTEASDIIIKDSKSSKIKLVIYIDKDRTTVNEKERILEIKTKQNKCKKFICTDQKIDRVELYLPDGYKEKVDVETNYGDIKIDNISRLDANTNYGDIKIGKVDEYFKVNTNYGDIKIGELDIIEDSKATTNLGDIIVGKTNEVNIKAKTDLGDTKVKGNNKDSNIKLELKTNLGDIKVNN